MSYQEEGQVRIRRLRSRQAIALAMQGRWREAVAANNGIIESFPGDVEAYNRLGRAYIELGEYSSAKESYSRTLELDPYNAIATKNLRRLSHLGEALLRGEGETHHVQPQHFIEEIGKAGVTILEDPAPPDVLARMVAGEMVRLEIDSSSLVVSSNRGEYLGRVEPYHAQRLISLMQGGNEYTAAIVNAAEDKVKVIVREVYQHPSQAGRLSFPPRRFETPRPAVDERMPHNEMGYEEVSNEE